MKLRNVTHFGIVAHITGGAGREIKKIAEDGEWSSRSPHGERGLKFGYSIATPWGAAVAPHTGSVD